jgi:hypothetical protein
MLLSIHPLNPSHPSLYLSIKPSILSHIQTIHPFHPLNTSTHQHIHPSLHPSLSPYPGRQSLVSAVHDAPQDVRGPSINRSISSTEPIPSHPSIHLSIHQHIHPSSHSSLLTCADSLVSAVNDAPQDVRDPSIHRSISSIEPIPSIH